MKEKAKEQMLRFLRNKTDRTENEDVLSRLIGGECGSRELLGKIWQHDLLEQTENGKTDKQKIIDKIHHRINISDDKQDRKSRVRVMANVVSKIAAVLFIPLLLYFLLDNSKYNDITLVGHDEYVEVFSQQGVRSKIVLPDGSNVWLNNASSIRYPIVFGKKRNIQLNGEGYFEIESDNKRPFVVSTSNVDVEVLGTKFNVASYSDDVSVEVALLEGEVALYANHENKRSLLSNLTSGSLACYMSDNNQYIVQKTDVRRHIAWREGKLCFYETPMHDVVRKMERWYNCEITIDDKQLSDMHLTATFEGENLEQALKLMSMAAPTAYRITPAKRLNDGTFSKQKVIIKKISLTK